MGLSTLFQPAPAKTANLSGGFTPITAGGGGNAPGESPDATNAPELTLAPGTGVMGAMAQGANQADMTGMVGRGIGLSPTGLFTGNVSPEGALSTVGNVALNVAGGMLPGYAIANATGKSLGALAGLATLFGSQGQQTDSHLSGPITDGLVAQIAQNQAPLNNPLNVVSPEFEMEDSGPTGNVSDAAASAAAAAAGEGGNTSDGPGVGAGAAAGVYHRGGTVTKTGPAIVQKDEEVVRASEADKPGVRAALKDINQKGTSPLEGGLRRVFGRA